MEDEIVKATTRAARMQKTVAAVARQVRIARANHLPANNQTIAQSGRLRKHHAMDCGNPQCGSCGNPRHAKGASAEDSLTIQEKKFLDVEREGLIEVQNT